MNSVMSAAEQANEMIQIVIWILCPQQEQLERTQEGGVHEEGRGVSVGKYRQLLRHWA